jgi:energy-coupling factor transport system ATP-binding protein
VKEKVTAVMGVFQLLEKKEMDPFSLPKGDREKTACASILVGSPEVVILDEPTTGLDHMSLKGLMDIIKELNVKGTTVIMITHSMETAALYGRTLLALSQGRVVFYGDKRDFFRDENLVKSVKAARTGIMELTDELNSKLLLNIDEFRACWRKK